MQKRQGSFIEVLHIQHTNSVVIRWRKKLNRTQRIEENRAEKTTHFDCVPA